MSGLQHDGAVLAAVSALWLVAMVLPGPDFLLVTRLSVTAGRRAGLAADFGIATGVALWGLAGFFGIHLLFQAAPWAYFGLKIAGGLYLAVLGFRLFRGSFRPAPAMEAAAPAAPAGRAYGLGLLTNLANPKAPLFVSSLFSATMPAQPPVALGLAAVALMFVIAAGWFALVACALTLPRCARLFARARAWIDRIAGVAFMGLGARLALDRG